MITAVPYFSGFAAKNVTARSLANASNTLIIFEYEFIDLQDEYDHTTGIYTCKKEGRYTCDWMVTSADATFQVGELFIATLNKNNVAPGVDGSRFFGHRTTAQTTTTWYATSNGSIDIDLEEDDTLHVEVFHNQDATINTRADGRFNYFSVFKMG